MDAWRKNAAYNGRRNGLFSFWVVQENHPKGENWRPFPFLDQYNQNFVCCDIFLF